MARILVTRPQPDGDETLARLRAIGIEGVAAPLLERAALHAGLPPPEDFAALAFTSANALRALDERGALAPYRGLKVFAVGEKTAAAATAFGFPEVVNAGGTVRHLVEEIAGARLARPILYPTARHQSADLRGELTPFGITVASVRVYEMRAVTVLPAAVAAGLQNGDFAAALFYSRRTAETFVTLTATLIGRAARARMGVLCLSEQVAEPLLDAHFVRVGLADHPSEAAMMTRALAFVRDQNTA